MSNMVNNMKYNVDDVVILDNDSNGVIVDIVDGGMYRVSTDNGIITVDESKIKGTQMNEEYEENIHDLSVEELKSRIEYWEDYIYSQENSDNYYSNDSYEQDKYNLDMYKKELEARENNLTEGKLMNYAKKFFEKRKKEKLNEGLQIGDMEHLVSPYISVDEYTSKIDQDDITIAFFCGEKEVADDLRDFIEKMYYIETRDIEISDSITKDSKYILFVELDRNAQFPKILVDIIDSVGFLTKTELKDWSFITLNMKKKQPLTIENIEKYVRLSPVNIDKEDLKIDAKEIKKESIEYSKGNITRKYIDEGYVSEEEMNKIIDESETLDENTLDMEILEYNIPEAQIFTTDNNIFVIKGNKIKKLGF